MLTALHAGAATKLPLAQADDRDGQRPRLWRRGSASSLDMRTKMRAYNLNELMSLTRTELLALHRRIVRALALMPAGSPSGLLRLRTCATSGRC